VRESHCVIATVLDTCSVITGLLVLIVHWAFHGCLSPCSCG
jgi:hypothetical protein